MKIAFLSILRKNVPHIRRLASFRVVFQKIIAFFSKFFRSTREFFAIRMRGSLLPPNYHPKIRDMSLQNVTKNTIQSAKRSSLLCIGQCRRKLNLSTISDTGNAGCRYYRSVYDFRFTRFRPDCISIIIVAFGLFYKMEDVFVNIPKAIFEIIHATLNLIPYHTVSKDPTLPISQLKYHPPRNP